MGLCLLMYKSTDFDHLIPNSDKIFQLLVLCKFLYSLLLFILFRDMEAMHNWELCGKASATLAFLRFCVFYFRVGKTILKNCLFVCFKDKEAIKIVSFSGSKAFPIIGMLCCL